MSGPLSGTWKGGRQQRDDGYWVIRVNGKRVREHCYIMEQHIGRPLAPGEEVHHIDEDRNNNQLSNLLLVPGRAEHKDEHRTTYRSDTHRQCSKCRKIKERSEFGVGKSNSDGLDSICKECRREDRRTRLLRRKPDALHRNRPFGSGVRK